MFLQLAYAKIFDYANNILSLFEIIATFFKMKRELKFEYIIRRTPHGNFGYLVILFSYYFLKIKSFY